MHHEDSILEHGADLGGAGVSRDREAVRKAAAGVFDGLAFLRFRSNVRSPVMVSVSSSMVIFASSCFTEAAQP